jgi:hypothetical protein
MIAHRPAFRTAKAPHILLHLPVPHAVQAIGALRVSHVLLSGKVVTTGLGDHGGGLSEI